MKDIARVKKENNPGKRPGVVVSALQDFILRYPDYADFFKKKYAQTTTILFVPKGMRIEEDVAFHLLEQKKDRIYSRKIIIIAEEYSHLKTCVTLIVETVASHWPIESIDFFIRTGAQLDFLYDDQVPLFSNRVGERFLISFYLESRACVNCYVSILDDIAIQNNFEFFLLGSHAKANIEGFYLMADCQQLQLRVALHHEARYTESRLAINGIVAGNADVFFKGAVFVSKEAQCCRVAQKNKTLLVGDTATVSSSPALEILNNDVCCQHGSAVGNLDENHLFYLQARGMSEAQAKKILIEGFFDFLLKTLDNHGLKEDLLRRLKVKMRQIL